MISKNTIKRLKSLTLKKFRQKEKLFMVEGDKNVIEVLQSDYDVIQLFATKTFLSENPLHLNLANQITEVTRKEIKRISHLKNPQNSLAVCAIPHENLLPEIMENELTLYLDGIQDPGNLGTLIRICDWFGISQVFCSADTVDLYNPKVIQSSMGSFCRVNMLYEPFEIVLNIARNSGSPVFGAFLDGKNIYTEKLPPRLLLVIGNEGNGIREAVGKKVHQKISVPAFSRENNGAESLNAAVATGIICAEFKRQQLFS